MARKGQQKRTTDAKSYRHDETRKNIPEAGLVDYVTDDLPVEPVQEVAEHITPYRAKRKSPGDYCWDTRA